MGKKMESDRKKNKIKLPLRAYLLYLFLASFLLTDVTLSKYIMVSKGGDSARVIKMGDVEIEESGDFLSDTTDLILIPGVDLEKTATVSFSGSEAACYLFVEVNTSNWTKNSDNYSFTPSDVNCAGKISWSVPSGTDGWTYLTSDGSKHVYYTVLSANEAVNQKPIIKPLVDGQKETIDVHDNLKASDIEAISGLSISFQATVVQYDGFGAKLGTGYTAEQHANAAWNAVKGK